jgi:hypothetical protein
MNEVKSDLLVASMHGLRQALAADYRDRDSWWADAVHIALGQAAAAIQEEVQAVEQSMANVGDINPDFQNAPAAERHVQATREQFIRLGEKVHQLRAYIRQAGENHLLDPAQLRLRGQEIADAIEKVRKADEKFLLDTVNSNPGAGE